MALPLLHVRIYVIISKNAFVTLDYTVFDTENNLLDSGVNPLNYLHGGYGDVFEKIEDALEGKSIGDSVHLELQPHESFGEYNEELVLIEEKSSFEYDIDVGQDVQMVFNESADENEIMLTYRIAAIKEDKVILDANHPLAGLKIVFDATVIGVRQASDEEIEARTHTTLI